MDRTRTPLSGVDNAWLQMDTPENPMVSTALIRLGGSVARSDLLGVLSRRLLRYERFRERVVELHHGAFWEESPDFDLSRHLIEESLDRPLEDRVSELLGTRLDRSKPLWELHHLRDGGDDVLVARLHHAIADGKALLAVLLTLTDSEQDGHIRAVEPNHPRHQALDLLLHPGRAFDAARRAAGGAAALGRILLLPPDPSTSLRGELGGRKRVAWSGPIPLERLRELGRPFKATVNDVLVALVAGGLRSYLENRGEEVEGLSFRSVVPVDLRRPEDPLSLGNQFGLVFLDLPVGIADPRKRLREAKGRMDALKHTPEAVVAFQILQAMGAATPQLEAHLVHAFAAKATLILSNLAGPRELRFLAGAPIGHLCFWAPQAGDLGLGVNLMSYQGQVCIAVAGDSLRLADPAALAEAFDRELVALGG